MFLFMMAILYILIWGGDKVKDLLFNYGPKTED